MTTQTAQIVEVQVPLDVMVSCPKNGAFKPASVANHCIGCAHFAGMLEIDPAATAFDERYRVQCACPLARRLTKVDL